MIKKRRIDEYNSSDLKNYIKKDKTLSSTGKLSISNSEYIDPTLNLL